MANRNVPQPFDIDKIRFKDCFTAPSLRHFSVLITGWVLTVGTHTVSQVILTTGLHESEHFSSVYKFFSQAKWDPDQVASVIFSLIVKTFLPDVAEYEVVIDDTLNNHIGKKMCGAGIQHDGNAPKSGKPIGFGLCFVTMGLVVSLEGISDRVFCLPYAARLWWPRKAKVQPKKTRFKTKSELASDLIEITRSWMDSSVTLRVIVDGGYSNNKVVKDRPPGVHVTGKVRRDGALYGLVDLEQPRKRGRPRKKGDRLPTPNDFFGDSQITWEWVWITLYGKQTIVETHKFEAIWYKAAGNEQLSIVLVRDPTGEYPDTAFFDTDTSASDEQTVQRYAHRWSTEITNRETKGLLGAADPQCRTEEAVQRTPMPAYWSYSLVRQAKLGISYKVKVLVGLGLTSHPYRVLRVQRRISNGPVQLPPEESTARHLE